MEWVGFEDLKGMTFASVVKVEGDDGDKLVFTTDTGDVYEQYHSQDCCESVYIESIVGDLQDLVGSEILLAEETISESDQNEDLYGSTTWSFYKLATIKGYVDIRWCGSSNGYYSETVSLVKR